MLTLHKENNRGQETTKQQPKPTRVNEIKEKYHSFNSFLRGGKTKNGILGNQWPDFDIFRHERQVPNFLPLSEALGNKTHVLIENKQQRLTPAMSFVNRERFQSDFFCPLYFSIGNCHGTVLCCG